MKFFIIFLQLTLAKKQKPTSILESPTTTVSVFFQDVADFLSDVMEAISDLFTSKKPKKSKPGNEWTITSVVNYATKNLRSGYKLIKDSVSIFTSARSLVDEVVPVLPNVPPAVLIEALLNRLVPELMNQQQEINDKPIDDHKL